MLQRKPTSCSCSFGEFKYLNSTLHLLDWCQYFRVSLKPLALKLKVNSNLMLRNVKIAPQSELIFFLKSTRLDKVSWILYNIHYNVDRSSHYPTLSNRNTPHTEPIWLWSLTFIFIFFYLYLTRKNLLRWILFRGVLAQRGFYWISLVVG